MAAEILNPYTNTPTAFDFWAPVFTDNNGKLYSPGFTDDRGDKFNLWDTVFINAAPTPGAATVSLSKDRDVDKKKAAGSDGARVTLHGVEPAQGTIQLVIWTPEQLKALNELWPIIFAPTAKGDQPPPYDVSHPTFKLHGVKSIQIVGGTGPDPGPVARSRVFTIKFIEYFPPGKKKATATPVQSKGSTRDPSPAALPGSKPSDTAP